MGVLGEQQIAAARAAMLAGETATSIARQIGCSPDTIRRLNPDWAERRRNQINAARHRLAQERGVTVTAISSRHRVPKPAAAFHRPPHNAGIVLQSIKRTRKNNLNNPTRRIAKANGHDPGFTEPAADHTGAHPVTLMDLTNTTCRWPIGDPGTPEFRFCGGPSNNIAGRPYCAHHAAVASGGCP